MIYTARPPVSTTIPQHVSFVQRKIENLSQSRLTDLNIYGKPAVQQIAFDNYRSNFEAFIWSTFAQKKTNVAYTAFPIPNYFGAHKFPLPLPQTTFHTKTKLNPEQQGRMMTSLAPYGIETVSMSKTTTAYTLARPTYEILKDKIQYVASTNTVTPKGHSSVHGTMVAARLYAMIEGAMRTHTYPAFKGNEEQTATYLDSGFDSNYELSTKRKSDAETTKFRKLQIIEGRSGSPRARGETPEPDVTGTLPPYTEVLFAKPSPCPSSASWGSPSDVPELPGILFPFFQGLLLPDPIFLKNAAAKLFFKLMPRDGDENARDGYKDFKDGCSMFAYTKEGVVVCHMLKGFLLAMETQAHAFFLFDNETYLGFVLSGALFNVWNGSAWVAPLSAQDLRKELDTLQTHDGALHDLAKVFNTLALSTSIIRQQDVDTSGKLASWLEKLELDDEDDADTVDRIGRLLAKLSFQPKYRVLTLDNLQWLLPFWGQNPPEWDINEHIYLNIHHRALYRDVRFKALAAFGPKGPSFFSAKGQQFEVPKPGDHDVQSAIDVSSGKMRMPVIIVGYKALDQAFRENKRMAEVRSIKFDVAERAQESRNYVFKLGGGREKLWEALRQSVGTLVPDEDISMPGPSKVGKKEKKAEVLAPGRDFDDLF